MKWLCQTNSDNSNKKRKIHNKDHSSDNWVSSKQRKRVSFLEDQQNSPQLSVTNRSMTNITPILETYGQQLETVQTSHTSSDTLDTDSQVNLFSRHSSAIGSDHLISKWIQAKELPTKSSYGTCSSHKFPSWFRHHQQYSANSPTITTTDFDWSITSTDKRFWGNGFRQSTRYIFTNFYTTSKLIQQYTKYSIHNTTHITFKKKHLQTPKQQHLPLIHNKTIRDKATEYYIITPNLILILIEEEWEDKTHITITKIENILGRMIDNKENQMDIYSLLSLDYDNRYVHIKQDELMVKNFKYYW